MNFNEEIANELLDLNLGGKVVALDQKDKGTSDDWLTLEKRIAYCVRENENMLTRSGLLADRSALC